MHLTRGESCPSCGSERVSLQGRAVQRRIVRELICLGCKYVWPAPKHLAASQTVEPTA